MPFGEYESFAACVAANQDKENPEAYCGALKAKLEGKSEKGALRKILEGVVALLGGDQELTKGVETIGVSVEAITRDGDRVDFRRQVPITKVDAEQRLVYGIVYEPDTIDAHGDFMTKAEIEDMAHRFMAKYRAALADAGTDHERDLSPDQLTFVESSIQHGDAMLGTQLVKAGSWVLVGKVHDDGLWNDVKTGRYTGWSFEGWGRRVPRAA